MKAREAVADALRIEGMYIDDSDGPADTVLAALSDAGFVLDALCPPGSRVVVDRTTKPCEVCGGEGGWEGNDGGGPDFECPSCGGSGVVEATTTYGLEDVELHWNGIEQAIDVYGDGRPEQYDASMPLYRAVALPEETPR